jgi:Predicted flavin-nucleotide-binding protein
MFREMRRFKQAMSQEECIAVLNRNTSGVLALLGDEDYPYAVPMNYVYHNGQIIFHCAKDGHKLDAIRRYEKASFCVIDKDEIVPEKFTSYYRSVIAFGKIHVLEEDAERRDTLLRLATHYSPDHIHTRMADFDKSVARVCMVALNIEHMTGKEAMELKNKG